MKTYYPYKTVKKIIKRVLTKKSRNKKVISEDDIDHIGTELYDELGPIPNEEEDAAFGLQEKGYYKPEKEDSL